MPDYDDTSQLETVVERILGENDLEAFAEYWALGRILLDASPVRAFYVCAEGSYVNLSILTDKSIIDIETDENDENPGDLTVIVIKAIAEAHFRTGPVQTIPDSDESQLTLVLSMLGATEAGPYWTAETDAERKHLTHFGKVLMTAINES